MSLTATANPSAASRSAVTAPEPLGGPGDQCHLARRPAVPARGHQITAPALGESTSPQYMAPSVAR